MKLKSGQINRSILAVVKPLCLVFVLVSTLAALKGGTAYAADPVPGLQLIWPVAETKKPTPQDYAEKGDVSATNHHPGLDIRPEDGADIHAAAGGETCIYRVADLGDTSCLGNVVIIEHGGAKTLYAHLSQIYLTYPETVAERTKCGLEDENGFFGYKGPTVTQDQRIGKVGNTGCSVPTHLHFELKDQTELRTGNNVYTPAHPDAVGYHDPVLNLHTGIEKAYGHVAVTEDGTGKYMRMGPDKRYRFVDQLEIGDGPFKLLNRLDSHYGEDKSVDGCSFGWYQIQNVTEDYFYDELEPEPTNGRRGEIPELWVCQGNDGQPWLVGYPQSSCDDDPSEPYSSEMQTPYSYTIDDSGDFVDAKICSPSDVDYYHFTLSSIEAGDVAITLDSPAGTTYTIEMYNEFKEVIGSAPLASGQNGLINKTLGEGDYYIKVKGVYGSYDSAHDYRLTIEKPNSCQLPLEIKAGGDTAKQAAYLSAASASCASPVAPTSIAATDGIYTDAVRVSWIAPYGATSFEVYRCSNNATGSCSTSFDDNTSPYSDTGTSVGRDYYYRVKSCNSSGCSDFSAADAGYRGSPTSSAPSVSIGSAANIGLASATLNASVNPNGASTTGYFEYGTSTNYGTATTPSGVGSGTTPTTLSQPVNSLSCDTTYYFRATATNAKGSRTSTNNLFRTLPCQSNTPAAPSHVTASDGTYGNGIVVSWDVSAGNHHYELYRATALNGSKTQIINVANWNQLSWADVLAVPGRIYYYWVKSCKADGACSTFSNPDTGFAGSEPIQIALAYSPDPEDGDEGVSIYLDELSWTKGASYHSYDVYFGTDSTPDAGELIGSTSSNSKSIPQLNYSTTYYWRLDTEVDGEKFEGPVWRFTTRAESLPDLPNRAINPSPEHLTDDIPIADAVLGWANGGGATSYDVYFGKNFQPGDAQFVGNVTGTNWPLPTLEYDQIYYWKIRARNAGGAAHGDIWRFKTEPSAPIAPYYPSPSNGQTGVSPASVTLYWQDLADKAQNFEVYFGTDPTPDASEKLGTTENTKWNIAALQKNTIYYWQIISQNNAGSTPGPIWSFRTWEVMPGTLQIADIGFSTFGLEPNGIQPKQKALTLRNIGEQSLDFTLSNQQQWLGLSTSAGSIPPDDEITVTLALDVEASNLEAGKHIDSVFIKNVTNNRGNTVVAVVLNIGVPLQPWDIFELAPGYYSAQAITADGVRWGWGDNRNLKLGIGPLPAERIPLAVPADEQIRWKSISSWLDHSIGITTDGVMMAWGNNFSGELGLGDNLARNRPTVVSNDLHWRSAATGMSFSLALKEDGRLYAWGNNGDGQLGLGDSLSRSIPTQVGTTSDWAQVDADVITAMGIKKDGSLYAWGDNAGSDGNNRNVPTRIGAFSDWSTISMGSYHMLAIRGTGLLYSWGDNGYGQLGLGDKTNRLTPVQIGTDTDWQTIAAGDGHSLALKKDGTLYAWGSNNYGQLGTGDRVERLTPVPIAQGLTVEKVYAVGVSSFAITNDGKLYGWGYGGVGQLGFGLHDNVLNPTEVPLSWAVIPTPLTTDTDGDGIVDAVDMDDDGDGMPDDWEQGHGFVATLFDGGEDPDNDDLTNVQEFNVGTHPHSADSDKDGLSDGFEVTHGLDPLVFDVNEDKDNDGYSNEFEFNTGHSPSDPRDLPSERAGWRRILGH